MLLYNSNNMDTLTKPLRHVENLLGKRPLLIYGDFDRGQIVLYGTGTLPKFEKNGQVYSRHIDLEDPLIMGMGNVLTDVFAVVYPRRKIVMRPPKFEHEESIEEGPDEGLQKLFGVSGSFGYVPSAGILNHFYPDTEIVLKKLPSDISLSHEGAHVVSIREIDTMFDEYEIVLSGEAMPDEIRRGSFYEAVAFWTERRYIEEQCPEWLDQYDTWRLDYGGTDVKYQLANRLIQEEQEIVEEMVTRIRDINLQG